MVKGGSSPSGVAALRPKAEVKRNSPSGVAALRPKAAAKRKRAECTKIEMRPKWISRGPVSKKQWEIAQEMAKQLEMGVAEHYSWDIIVRETLAAAQKVQDEEEEQIQDPETPPV